MTVVLRPGINDSGSLARLSDREFRAWAHMGGVSDEWLRLSGDPGKIAASCFARVAWSESDVEAAIEALIAAGLIEVYLEADRWTTQLLGADDYLPHELRRAANLRNRKSRWPEKTPASVVRPMSDLVRTNGRPSLAQARARDSASASVSDSVTGSPTVDLLPAGDLPISQQLEEASSEGGALDDWRAVAARLNDSDEGTPAVLAAIARGLPEAAIARALESLEYRRRDTKRAPLVSEVRYFVASLKRIRDERAKATV